MWNAIDSVGWVWAVVNRYTELRVGADVMASYIHKKCGGDIAIFRRKCKKCGKKWNDAATLIVPPKDWILLKYDTPRKSTSYAKWGDKVPYVGWIAGKLPNWPKWARVTAFFIYILAIGAFIAWAIRSCVA